MDPFVFESDDPSAPHNSGHLYINLGSISEDILPDGAFSQEQGLPTATSNDSAIETSCGIVPRIPVLIGAFDNNPTARPVQDVGYDGMSDPAEVDFHQDYITNLETNFGAGSQAYKLALSDPASDKLHVLSR